MNSAESESKTAINEVMHDDHNSIDEDDHSDPSSTSTSTSTSSLIDSINISTESDQLNLNIRGRLDSIATMQCQYREIASICSTRYLTQHGLHIAESISKIDSQLLILNEKLTDSTTPPDRVNDIIAVIGQKTSTTKSTEGNRNSRWPHEREIESIFGQTRLVRSKFRSS